MFAIAVHLERSSLNEVRLFFSDEEAIKWIWDNIADWCLFCPGAPNEWVNGQDYEAMMGCFKYMKSREPKSIEGFVAMYNTNDSIETYVSFEKKEVPQ